MDTTEEQMRNMKDVLDTIIDIFIEILCKPYATNTGCLLKDVEKRLKFVDGEKWKNLRTRLNGEKDQISDNKDSPSLLFLHILNKLDTCSQAVLKKVQVQIEDMTAMELKVKQQEERLTDCQDALFSQKSQYNKQLGEVAGLEAKVRHLQGLVEEKSNRVVELQKSDNVQLWESEKKRVLKESTEKIEILEKEIEEMKQGRERYKQRMLQIESSYRKLQLKQKLAGNGVPPISENGGDAVDDLSRRNFMQDKDIVWLERELYNLQTNTVGVLGGIKTDFQKLGHNFINEGQVDPEFEVLSSRMEKVYDAVAEGDIQKAKEKLPPHYTYTKDDDFKVKRIRRVSQAMILPNQKVLKSIVDERLKTENLEKNTNSEPNAQNPVIVVPETRKLHSINPLKYFPCMSRQFILDQYEKFEEFDRNGDGSLDLPEVVKLVANLGFNFNAHQLQDAMLEVDMDNNYMLDFYEYLLIIDKIYRRNGKAEVFTSGLSQLKKNNMSKSCVIQ